MYSRNLYHTIFYPKWKVFRRIKANLILSYWNLLSISPVFISCSPAFLFYEIFLSPWRIYRKLFHSKIQIIALFGIYSYVSLLFFIYTEKEPAKIRFFIEISYLGAPFFCIDTQAVKNHLISAAFSLFSYLCILFLCIDTIPQSNEGLPTRPISRIPKCQIPIHPYCALISTPPSGRMDST